MNNVSLHGNFEKINDDFITKIFSKFNEIDDILKEYNKSGDPDSIIDESRDAKVGKILNFNYINTNKHGWDLKDEERNFLESKKSSINNQSPTASFNDTTIEKAESFIKDNITIALSVWAGLGDLSFIVYGCNPKIGEFLKEKVKNKKPESRSTQSISAKNLIEKYNFKVKPINMSKEDIAKYLKLNINNIVFE